MIDYNIVLPQVIAGQAPDLRKELDSLHYIFFIGVYERAGEIKLQLLWSIPAEDAVPNQEAMSIKVSIPEWLHPLLTNKPVQDRILTAFCERNPQIWLPSGLCSMTPAMEAPGAFSAHYDKFMAMLNKSTL